MARAVLVEAGGGMPFHAGTETSRSENEKSKRGVAEMARRVQGTGTRHAHWESWLRDSKVVRTGRRTGRYASRDSFHINEGRSRLATFFR